MNVKADQKRKQTRTRLAAAGLLLGVLVLGVSCSDSKPSFKSFAHGGLAKLVVLDKAPPQPANTFTDKEGKTTSLAAFRGKVVVVNIWASWCAPCKEEMPTLGALAEKFKGQPVAVVPITVDKEADRDLALATLTELAGDKLDLYQAPSYDITYDAQAAGFPTTIIYSKTGVELARLSGGADWASKEANGLIEAALKE